MSAVIVWSGELSNPDGPPLPCRVVALENPLWKVRVEMRMTDAMGVAAWLPVEKVTPWTDEDSAERTHPVYVSILEHALAAIGAGKAAVQEKLAKGTP